jgi:hypothetical protein
MEYTVTGNADAGRLSLRSYRATNIFFDER